MTRHPDDPTETPILDDLFAQSREARRPVPSDLMARVLADARQVQPQARSRRSVWAMLSDLLGGRAVLAGLGAAAACGLALGLVLPADLLPETTVDLFPLAEGLIVLLDEGA